jgi:peptide chain release factor subunit 3
MEILDDIEVPKRNADAPLRIPILDKMRDRGYVVFGKVEQGTVRMNDKISLVSSNIPCQVVNLYNSKGEPVAYAKPGENVQIRLLGITDEN